MINVAGQQHLKNYIENAKKFDRIAHSFILFGPQGIGKFEFSLYMAQSFLCSSPKPCGHCATCEKIEKNAHADVKVIDNGRKSVGVSEVRKLIEEVNTRPYESDKKIIIIKNAELITPEAQNALLKTIEEPPANVIILLLVELIDELLATIKSRCQVLRFERVSKQELIGFLSENGYNNDEVVLTVGLSDGIPGKATKFLDEKNKKLRREVIETFHRITDGSPIIGFGSSKFFMDNKDEFDYIMDILTVWNRDILVFKSIRNKNNILNKDYYDLIVEESQLLSYNRLDRILDTIKDTRDKVKQYANFQLAIEMMLLKFQEV